MPWIELHHGFPGHRKVGDLAKAMGVERRVAIGTLACLWSWAVAMTRHGDVTGTAEEIAHAAYFRGDPDVLIAALVQSGWIDRDEQTGALTIHDWDDYAGRYEDAKAKARERKRAERDRKKSEPVTVTSRGRHADGHGDVTVTSRKTERDGHANVTPYMTYTDTLPEPLPEPERNRTNVPLTGDGAPEAHTPAHEGFDPWLDTLEDPQPAPIASAAVVSTVGDDAPVVAPEAPHRAPGTKRGAAKVPESLRVIWGELPAKAKRDPDKTAKAWQHALTNPHPLAPKVTEAELVTALRAWAGSQHVAAGFVVPVYTWLAEARWTWDWASPRPQGGQSPGGRGGGVTGGLTDEFRAKLMARLAQEQTTVTVEVIDDRG